VLLRQDIDRVDLAAERIVWGARGSADAEPDHRVVVFGDEDEMFRRHGCHDCAPPRAVVTESVEEAVWQEAAIRVAPGVGADALDRIGIIHDRTSHAHGANLRLRRAVLGDWVIFFLALLLVPVLLLEETSTEPVVVGAATVANAVIWVLFALDYAIDLWRAPDRGAHVRSHWWDLALLVVSPPLLVPPEAQALRVLRAARLLRAFVVIGVAYDRLDRPLTRAAALVIVGVLFVVILAGGLLIHSVEPATFPNVLQAYAWAVATVVTAGHAPPEPVTVAGRAISSTIVVMGLGTFVALAASLAGRR
jgi:voltage-gated potassium channel